MTFAIRNHFNAVFFAEGRTCAGIPAMHPSVPNGVHRFNMVRAATPAHVTLVVDMASRGLVQRLINKAVNLLQFRADTNVPVTVAVQRARPYPASSYDHDTPVELQEVYMCEHPESISNTGFNATEIAAPSSDERAVGEAETPDSGIASRGEKL